MSPRDLVYVGHMLDMAKKAISKTQSLSRGAYDADENLRLALTHLIQIIGEAGRQVSREFSDRQPAEADFRRFFRVTLRRRLQSRTGNERPSWIKTTCAHDALCSRNACADTRRLGTRTAENGPPGE